MIHRAVSVSFVSKKKNGTSPATLLREASIQSREVRLAHDCAGRDGPCSLLRNASVSGPLQPSVKRLASDGNKLLKTFSILAYAWSCHLCGTFYDKASIQTSV
jgi:hypothetical protein